MYKNLVLKYAENMTMDDMNNFVKSNNIIISEDDKKVVFNHIKKYYNVFFNDPIKYIKMLKSSINDDVYYNILELYDKYKNLL